MITESAILPHPLEAAERIAGSSSPALVLAMVLLFVSIAVLYFLIRRNRVYLEARLDRCEQRHAACEKRLNRVYIALASLTGGRRRIPDGFNLDVDRGD